MTVALIIPVFNEEKTLPRLLDHLMPMAFDEMIVVDGGSHDRTVEVVRAYLKSHSPSTIRLLESPRGRAAQMNAGAASATAEILVFLHADTNLPANARMVIQQVMDEAACVGGRFDVRFPMDRGWAWVISRMMNVRSRVTGICTGDQTLFVRREIFRRMGGFADIPLMEDIEFTTRLKSYGKIAALRETVTTSFRRWERQGPLRTVLRMWTLRFLYWMGCDPKTLSYYYDAIR